MKFPFPSHSPDLMAPDAYMLKESVFWSDDPPGNVPELREKIQSFFVSLQQSVFISMPNNLKDHFEQCVRREGKHFWTHAVQTHLHMYCANYCMLYILSFLSMFVISVTFVLPHTVIVIYINKNVNVRLYITCNLWKFFTDRFEILTQRCIRIWECLYTYLLHRYHT